MWGWGQIKYGRVPWSQFREACDFFHKGIITEDEFGILVNGVLSSQIRPDDIREIVRLKKKNTDKPFGECCREILNTVPKTIKSIVFIADLDADILEDIRSKANEKSITDEDEAERALLRSVEDGNVEGVLIKDDKYIKIAFTEEGRRNLSAIMRESNEAAKNIVNNIFKQAGYDHAE